MTLATDRLNLASNVRKGLRQDIQGLRAIAVLTVMLFHVNKEWLPGGFVGVDVFLVISGFLITTILLDQKDSGDFNLLRFYWGRLKRILPACCVMLAVFSIIAAYLFIPKDFKFYRDSLESSLYFVSNQYFSGFGDYFSPGAHELPLLHTWSLAVEMQFYLVLPFLLAWLPLHWVKVIIPALIVLFTAYAEYALRVKGLQQEMYFSLSARAPEFLLGSMVAVFRLGERWSSHFSSLMGWLGFLLLASSLFLIKESYGFPGLVALLPCVGTALLIASQSILMNRFLSLSILVWIGGLSYSLYLWHWPVLSIMRYYVGHYSLELPWLAAFILITFFAAWFSFRWIETPFRKARTFAAAGKKAVLLSLGVFPLIFVAGNVNTHAVDPLPTELTRYASQDEICHGKIIGDCVRGNGGDKPPALLLGDSHGAQLNHFFDVVGTANKFNVRIITGSSCVPITGFDVERLPKWAQLACLAQIDAAKAFVDNSDTIIFAGMWQYQTQSAAFMVAFDAFLNSANAQGKKVLVMAQIPMFASNLLRVQRFSSLGFPVTVENNDEWQQANIEIAKVADKYPLVEFIDFSNSDFFSSAPFGSDILLYQDNHHLNEVGARNYGQFVVPFFKEFEL
ncbi:acyltransferase [Pseudomonas sp. CrR25]|nr:acyltransferase [Pseudomonas sp. CrR25]